MGKYKYLKCNAFTAGKSEGNPAACVFTGNATLSPGQMLTIAAEHKGFVMETVFCSASEQCDCKLTYYSSECEVDFCGHGTIATMYSLICDTPEMRSKKVITIDTNRKGTLSLYNEIDTENAVYIEAPAPVEHPVKPSISQIASILQLTLSKLEPSRKIRLIDAGLRTLIVPVSRLEDEISIYPNELELKAFAEANNIDIFLIYSMEVADTANFAHTRVFAPRFGYLEDPATGSGNSAFANYLISEKMWDGHPIAIEQGGNNRIYNSVRLKVMDGKVLFGGKATRKIEGWYFTD